MKRCTYCGQEYPDERSTCFIDGKPLESCDPTPVTQPPDDGDEEDVSIAAIDEYPTETDAPDGFRSLGMFETFEADRLLKKFEAAGVRFQIDLDEKRVFTGGGLVSGAGYVRSNWIEIFVKDEDEQKATKIISADWKV